ncbi:MAG: S9 family peptidase [Crocinitomicaceae bacterium]|nr:S9 family peptidase [Crocinitomicaceae bacterium]
MRNLFLISIGVIVFNIGFSQKDITVESIYKYYEFYPKGVSGFNGMKDGQSFTKISSLNGIRSITKHKITSYKDDGETLLNLTDLTYNGTKINVEDYQFNDNETKLVLLTETNSIYRRSFNAIYYIYDLKTKTLEALDEVNTPQTLATFSPDGKKIAYISENNIYYKDLASKKTIQVTTDGSFNHIINGTTDWVYEEEFAITQAFGWSPDSKNIAFLKFDESKVKEFTLEYNTGQLYPELYTFKYPKAGEDNSKVSTHIYSLENMSTQNIQLQGYEYIPRISWSNINNTLILQTLNRHQNHVNYYKVEQKSNNWIASIFYSEKNQTYIDIDDNLIFLNNGSAILRTSEKDGFNHIYKIGFDGTESQITKGNWDVINFCGIDNKDQFVYYTAAKKGAIHQGVYKIALKGNKDVAISSETGQNTVVFTPEMNYFIKKHSTANTPPIFTLCDNKGKEIVVMERNETLQTSIKNHEFAQKEFISFDLDGYSLNGWMIKPNNFDASKKYPVYINIYGGPGSNMVYDGWDFNNAWHQLLAQEGYIVVSVDPRGTLYRGKQFKDITYLQLGKYETEDFIKVAQKLQTYDYIDGNRIGIQGWSYGGFMTTLAMTKGDGLFKMGIAVAPVTNWMFYDNIYTERFMRTPQENEDGYNSNSPINFANGLKGNYLLIHGSGDDNVHVQNTLEMINALITANKQFNSFIYPNRDHGIYGGNTRLHLFTMMLNFVKEKL